MTREDKRYVIALLITILLTIWGVILFQRVSGQPQPVVEVDRDVWALLEFDNGAQWYVRRSAVMALHTVPKENQDALGHKTIIYLQGMRINTPFTAIELQQKMKFGEVVELIQEGQ